MFHPARAEMSSFLSQGARDLLMPTVWLPFIQNAAGISLEGGAAVLLQGLHYGHKLLPGEQHSVHYGLLLAPVVRCLPPVLEIKSLGNAACMLINSLIYRRPASLQVCMLADPYILSKRWSASSQRCGMACSRK